MKLTLLTLVLTFTVSSFFAQCFFGFEQLKYGNSGTDSALVIKKYGFPLDTEFRSMHISYSGMDTVFVTETSHANDTLSYSNQPDTLGSFWIAAISSANDTLSFFKSGAGKGYPESIDLLNYTAPSSLTSHDGEIEFYADTTLGLQTWIALNGDTSVVTVFDSLAAGIVEGVYQEGSRNWSFSFIMGDPEDWVNVNPGDITCPVGVDLASEVGACDGEAFISGIQNGSAPFTYDWDGNGSFVSDTVVSDLCVGNQYVVIKDQNGFTKTCAFVVGSSDNGYFPPVQPNDTVIHTYTDYCVDPSVDSMTVIGSEIIDSISISVIWSFYSGTVLNDQILDTVYLNTPNPSYNNVELNFSLICNGDTTTKSITSVYSTYGYFSLPFSVTGELDVQDYKEHLTFSAYPNPIDDFLNVSTKDMEVQKVKIINALGQEIEPEIHTISNKHLKIDFRNLSKGSYMLKIFTKNNSVFSKRVIKN